MQSQPEIDIQSPVEGKEGQSPSKEDQSPVKEKENQGQKGFIKDMETFQKVFKITIPFRLQLVVQLIAILLLFVTYFNNLYTFSNPDEGDCIVTFIGVKVCQQENNQILSWSSIIDCDGKAENLCSLSALLPYFNAFIIVLIFASLLNRIWALNGESIFDWTLVESIIVLIFQLIIIILLKAFSIDEYSVDAVCYALEIISFLAMIASTLLDIKLRKELIAKNGTESIEQTKQAL